MYPSQSRAEILRALPGREWGSVLQRARKLGVRRKAQATYPQQWTQAEDELMSEVFGFAAAEDLDRLFPRHTYMSTKKRAYQLGLGRFRRDADAADATPVAAHHREMVRKYFARSTASPSREAQTVIQQLEAGIVAMVNRINAGRQDARYLRR